jgi:hypothetical protein
LVETNPLDGLTHLIVEYVSNNLILLIVLLEYERVIALIAVNNKELISAYNPSLYILIKVL